MAWAMNLCGMASIHSFEQAQAHWAQAEPWRNKHTSWRPLQGKRKEHVRLVKLADERGYECVLYNTPMVTYYANGDVKVIGYDSAASRDFAWHVVPEGIEPISTNRRMFWKVDTPEGERFYRDDKYLLLAHAPENTWHLVNKPMQLVEKVLNKKLAAKARQLMSHYDRWYKLTARLDGLPTISVHAPDRAAIEMLLNDPENIEDFHHAYCEIGPPANARKIVYELCGAYADVAVPHDRLPRKQK